MTVTSSVSTGVMRAACVTGPCSISVRQTEIPIPGPGQVRVQIEGCGVCGSSVPLWQGRSWFQYPVEPGAPGHEGWGIIDEVGPEVDDLAPGDRVGALSYHAFAEFDIADERAVVKLPRELDDRPFPGEALGCALNVFDRCDIRSDDVVVVVGIGFLGALLVQLAVDAGAHVMAVSRRPFALEMARSFGAVETVELDDTVRVHERLGELSDGRGAHRVIEAAGVQRTLDLAGDLVMTRGRLIIAGYHQDGPRQVNMQQWNWKGIDVINAHERDDGVYIRGMRRAAEAIAGGRLRPDSLYTHKFGLDEVNFAFEAISDRPDGFMKALVLT